MLQSRINREEARRLRALLDKSDEVRCLPLNAIRERRLREIDAELKVLGFEEVQEACA